ncbi:XRN 5'-3' exonuclease N-terminus-domain-containing protein [Massariosphaeria phaeospora]|uniref:5'-3' exoribonuclease n=1 Tax=Massariosphaeria phaeospora TaxID=100035 RepID=A0A7C8MCM2_9PLEO|nr:XRN 5'-3' exonuclease N-terminus-domain-containing protein [Massariosphaeria phaeospora]
MGVPAMFRWLSQKYPKIVSGVKEEMPQVVDGVTIPVDRSKPNPNEEEFDNLYLDMNGIVHPCSHPEDKPAPKTESDMMMAIFEYMDRLVGMVRPRKLLYLAVDGVAPRAKMNQQRSRRFRSAREAKEKDEERAEFVKMLNSQKASRGEDINTLDEVIEKTWDSNAITPGTPFMHLLAESLEYWCSYKFTTDPSWKDMKVIVSDASVPGEGEHKIMNFVRSQRAMPTHDPNTRHVICGLDADLIMLGLATHEPHFRVLREDVFFDSGKDKKCLRCGRKGHIRQNCPHPDNGTQLTEAEADEEWATAEHPAKPHIWLHVNVLREYLAVEMDSKQRRFPYNLERALDDWVFMCFFVGNDFLPHLPSLEIRDQGIDTLLRIWRELLPKMDDYITKDGYPDMHSVQLVLESLASKEEGIFRKRKEVSDRQAANRARREAQQNSYPRDRQDAPSFKRVKEDTSTFLNAGIPFFAPQDAQSNEVRNVHKDMMDTKNQTNKSAAAQLKALMKAKTDGSSATDGETAQEPEIVSVSASAPSAPDTPVHLGKRKHDAVEDSDNGTPGRTTPVVPQSPVQSTKKEGEIPEDTIKLWEPGYEDRYYVQKFHVAAEDIEFRHKVGRAYAEGLCWVLAYYMQGCPSWTWYYPYHYAPFATDFVALEDLDPRTMFTKGVPFHPYEQLMGVLPAASNHAIPEPYRILMSDPKSSIIDFYPEDFPIDLNGKKFAWQGVAVLPFIDEKRLLAAMKEKYDELSDDEKKRNEFGKETLLFSQENALFETVDNAFYRKGDLDLDLDPEKSQALHGFAEIHSMFVLDSQLVPPFDAVEEDGFELVQDRSMRVHYEMPKLEAQHAHRSMLLKGVQLPPKALSEGEEAEVRRAQDRNNRGGGRGGRGGFGNGRGRGGGGYDNDRQNFNGGRGPPDYSQGSRAGFDNGRGEYGNGRGGYGGGYGGYDNRGGYGNGNGRGGYGDPGGYPPRAFPGGPPPPRWSGNGQYVPPPPPGWVPPPQYGGRNGPGGGQNQYPPPRQQTYNNEPPPRQAPNNNSLRDEQFYRPADEILGRNGGGGGQRGGGRGAYDGRGGRGGNQPRY